MINPGEIAALNAALASFDAYAARVAAVAADASWFSLLGTSGRMAEIADEVAANRERFRARRDELVAADPTDHEAIAAYVESIRRITGSETAAAMAAEVQATDPASFVAAVAGDTASTITRGLGISAAVGVVALVAWLLLTRRK